jgi:drug/metabolite transporter (DMT)-like permease
MDAIAMILAAVAYAAFYAAAPGRQSKAVEPSGLYLWIGIGMTLSALSISIVWTGTAVGPVLVLTAMMVAGSALAILGPFVLPGGGSRNRRSRAKTSAGRPPSRPAARPVNLPTQSNR